MPDCPGCDAELEVDEFPFGAEVTCKACGKTWETDWDYTDAMEGSMAWWPTREVPA